MVNTSQLVYLLSAFMPIILGIFYLDRRASLILLISTLMLLFVKQYTLANRMFLTGEKLLIPIEVCINEAKAVLTPKRHQILNALIIESPSKALNGKVIRLSNYTRYVLKPNQKWRLVVKLKQPHAKHNFYAKNEINAWVSKRLYAFGYITSRKMELIGKCTSRARKISSKVKKSLDNSLLSSSESALIKKITLNENSQGLNYELFQQTGTSHLLAISGFHIGIITYFLSIALSLVIKNRLLHYIVTCSILLFYACTITLSPSVIRAIFTFGVIQALICLDFKVNKERVVTLIIVFLIFFNPSFVFQTSFFLSFYAVGLIFIFINSRFYLNKYAAYLSFNLLMSAGVLPVTLYFFDSISLSALASNLIVVPIFSLLILPLSLTIVMLALKDITLDLSFWLASQAIGLAIKVLEVINRFPTGYFLFYYPNKVWLLLFFVICTIGILPKDIPKSSFILILFLLKVSDNSPRLSSGDFQVTVFDVGQGLSLLITTKNTSSLYDVGPGNITQKYNHIANSIIIPELLHRKYSALDNLIISHQDSDHFGGFNSVTEVVGFKNLYSSNNITNHSSTLCRAGKKWQVDEVTFEFLSPEKLTGNKNDDSCVLRISNKNHSILMPGDISKKTERKLIKSKKQLNAEILVSPHHGSNTSSSVRFLKHVNPKLSIFSSGFNNQYNLPSKHVIERHNYLNIRHLNTAADGAVKIYCSATSRCTITTATGRHFYLNID